MTEKELFEKNLILTTEFDRYLLEHPEIAEQIPLNAQIVLLPEDDPELCQKNLEVAAAQREPGQPVVESQESSVQVLPSSQPRAAPPPQTPP